MWRRVMAVLAGYLVVALITMLAFSLAFPEAMGQAMEGGEAQAPGFGATVGLLALGVVTGLAGGGVAGFLGGARDGRTLGVVMTALGFVSMALSWGKQPVWFQAALIAIAYPSAAAGGALAGRRRKADTPRPDRLN